MMFTGQPLATYAELPRPLLLGTATFENQFVLNLFIFE